MIPPNSIKPLIVVEIRNPKSSNGFKKVKETPTRLSIIDNKEMTNNKKPNNKPAARLSILFFCAKLL